MCTVFSHEMALTPSLVKSWDNRAPKNWGSPLCMGYKNLKLTPGTELCYPKVWNSVFFKMFLLGWPVLPLSQHTMTAAFLHKLWNWAHRSESQFLLSFLWDEAEWESLCILWLMGITVSFDGCHKIFKLWNMTQSLTEFNTASKIKAICVLSKGKIIMPLQATDWNS